MIIINCKRCGHRWTYKGNSVYYVSCPRCRNNIKLNEPPKFNK